ncbi:MAG: hypothetical protein ACLFV6_01485 [Spirulinaceae cyanobacterium]
MSTQEQSRELFTEERQDNKNRHDSMEARAKSEEHQDNEQAREIATKNRQYQGNLEDTMRDRAQS